MIPQSHRPPTRHLTRSDDSEQGARRPEQPGSALLAGRHQGPAWPTPSSSPPRSGVCSGSFVRRGGNRGAGGLRPRRWLGGRGRAGGELPPRPILDTSDDLLQPVDHRGPRPCPPPCLPLAPMLEVTQCRRGDAQRRAARPSSGARSPASSHEGGEDPDRSLTASVPVSSDPPPAAGRGAPADRQQGLQPLRVPAHRARGSAANDWPRSTGRSRGRSGSSRPSGPDP